ncbi:conjugal transfer protein TraG N-terminal domain-containing protein [Cellvibrio sp. ARAG 10.3]|uniref:conjugal transfer protein TraG N-terminal domain-containing protein n=1 Tax=Cellvibrio sp. ARAG 10.3 TaxID=3451358 RepID=UPI003F481403
MIVSSSIELYTTVLGWFMFNSLWDLLTGTGVALIPFAFIVIRNLIEARKSRDKTDIGVQAFARSEIELYVAFFVLILCCNPAINLAPQSVRANIHQCEVNGDSLTQTTQEIRIGQTGTTYDRIDALELDGRTPKVPIIWYIWDFFSSGLSTTAAGILPCQPDLRRISTELATLQIHDKQLRDETAMFYRDCWRPSLNRYLRDKPPVPQEIKDIDQDIMWPGSRFFLGHSSYYSHYRTTEGLWSIRYDRDRDSNIVTPEYSDGRGFPYCRQWWLDESDGLHGRLLDYFADELGNSQEQSTWSAIMQVLTRTSQSTQDDLLRALLSANTDIQRLQINNNYPRDGFWRGTADAINASAAAFMSIPDRTKARMYRDAGPLVQAVILMFFTVVTPLLLVLSGYRLDVLVTLLAVKFSVFFWSFLFAIAVWMDNFFLAAVTQWGDHSDPTTILGVRFSNDTGMDVTVEAIRYVIRSLFFVLPLLFTMLVGMAGVKGSAAMSNVLTTAANPVAAAATPPKSPR